MTPDRLIGYCSCRKYDDYMSPCCHTITCILYLSRDPFPYFSLHYDWNTLMRTYNRPIQPILIQDLQLLPGVFIRPLFKRPKRGQPRISRIRANSREEGQRQRQRRGYNCSVCL